MQMRKVDPNDVGIDPMNERQSDVELDDEFVDNVSELGIVQPPIVREPDEDTDEDVDFLVVIGQRRVLAAREAELDRVYVMLADWDNAEALKASITENMDLFRHSVPSQDRAQALQHLWEMMGGSGMPVQSHLGAKLGVPRETIRTWLEPLHEDWKSTSIDPNSDKNDIDTDALGERVLAEIRRMTNGGDEGEEVAKMVLEADLTQPQVIEMRELVEEEGLSYEEAIDELTDDEDESESVDEDSDDGDSESSGTMEANVQFDSTTTQAMSSYAEENDTEPAIVVVDAVQYFLESEGYL